MIPRVDVTGDFEIGGLNMKSRLSFIFVTVFMLVLFAFKDLMILFSDTWPHLYAVVNNPTLSWEEITAYLPFASHFSFDQLLPVAPAALPHASEFSNFPALTLMFQGVLLKTVFQSNIDYYLLFTHSVLPTLSFWVLFFIYRQYVSRAWSLLLAFFGVTFIRNFSSLKYALDSLTGAGSFIERASLSPLEITRTPSPALTFFVFILLFYLSIRDYRPSVKRYCVLTVCWAAQIYIYLFNFIAGMLFWYAYILFTRLIQDKGLQLDRIIRTYAVAVLLTVVVVLPWAVRYYAFQTPLDIEFMARMGALNRSYGAIAGEWGFWISYVLPLALMVLVCWVSRADTYELFYQFTPVFIMIAVELIVLNLHMILGEFFQPYLFSIRIGNYFCRYLYFLPILYFISNPKKRFYHSSFILKVLTPLYELLSMLVVRGRHLIAWAGILSITAVTVASGLKFVNHHNEKVAPAMVEAESRYLSLSAVSNEKGSIASEQIAANLLIPVLSYNETLLVNSFSNKVPGEEILDRLVFFAQIFKWPEERFIRFMMPSARYDTFYTDVNYSVDREVLNEGFGFWLLNHRRQMTEEELTTYHTGIISKYRQFDMKKALGRFKLIAVESTGPVHALLPVRTTVQQGKRKIYYIGGRS